MCEAVRLYFREFGVTADREVQLYRRQQSKDQGGLQGSEVDVLFTCPAVASVTRDQIKVPIEVKYAHNSEAKTNLRYQLVERYMTQAGAEWGIYVVVWMGVSAGPQNRPLWPSIAEAKVDLEGQALQIAADTGGAQRVRVVILDASLPQASQRASKKPAVATEQIKERKKLPKQKPSPIPTKTKGRSPARRARRLTSGPGRKRK